MMKKRILLLCAVRSVRSLMAASILTEKAETRWDIWSTPVEVGLETYDAARRVLEESHISLLMSPQTTEPSFGLHWDEGIILCSGSAST